MLARILDRLVRPLGVRCVAIPQVLPAPELPDRCLEHARIVADRADILRHLPKGGVVAEVGVGFGIYSRKIIEIMQPAQFVAIDTFELDKRSWRGSRAHGEIFGKRSHEAYYRDQFAAEIASGALVIGKGYSHLVLEQFPDEHFDMIYIDAAHDYDSVRRDLAVANRKVKRDGYLVLNDYTVVDPILLQHYDIVRAVHEFCLQERWGFAFLALHRFMFCDVALRRLAH